MANYKYDGKYLIDHSNNTVGRVDGNYIYDSSVELLTNDFSRSITDKFTDTSETKKVGVCCNFL